ncbi:hypothetical protein AAFN47_04225 [Hoeflea sp. CAU 1731]
MPRVKWSDGWNSRRRLIEILGREYSTDSLKLQGIVLILFCIGGNKGLRRNCRVESNRIAAMRAMSPSALHERMTALPQVTAASVVELNFLTL